MLKHAIVAVVVLYLAVAAVIGLRSTSTAAPSGDSSPTLIAQAQPPSPAPAPPQKAPPSPSAPAPGAPPATPQRPGPSGGPPPGAPGMRPPGMPMFTPVVPDSFAAERDSLMNELLQKIAGKENVAAESVFKNIKTMKGMPASRLLRVMNNGFGKSLGVGCQHCHVVGHWADEDKNTKQVARDMMAMASTINHELLPKIKNLRSQEPTVGCMMCHRGQARPGIGR